MSWSRRRFIRNASLVSGVIAMGGFAAVKMPSIAGRLRVLSFHLDQPYIDVTGEDLAYRPAAGARGAAPLAELSDAELSRYYGVI